MNNKIFVDTAAWIALINRDDIFHKQAKIVMNQLRKQKIRLITTDFVLIEVANALSRPPFRTVAISFINGLKNLKTLQVVPASEEILKSGWLLYSNRTDKEWSLTDCISFEVMRYKGIAKAFTSDHHFYQAGFVNLM